MNRTLKNIFEPELSSCRVRAKFLSRVFGIFSENIVSIWASHERSAYQDLGRPTIRIEAGGQGHILDFTLRDRRTGKIYICEMKCEIEFQNFKYFVLESASQLDHHRKPAFEIFLKAARPENSLTTTVNREEIEADGAILIWGAVTPSGRNEVVSAKGLHDVISIEDICADLTKWECSRYADFVEERRAWCNRLFDGLLLEQGGDHVNPVATEAPLRAPVQRGSPNHAGIKASAKNGRTDEQERALKKMSDALGWPADSKQREAFGISNTGTCYGECHYAWIVMETFTRNFGREPTPSEREELAVRHGLNPGNVRAEYSSWRRGRTKR